MAPSRRVAIAGLLVAMVLLNAAILSSVLATVFFAITVAYILLPLSSWVRRRGSSRWVASAVATSAAIVGLLALTLPLFGVLYLRRTQVIEMINALPDVILIEIGEFSYRLTTAEITSLATQYLSAIAVDLATQAAIIATKLVVFVFVVFAILFRREELGRALLAPIPDAYHDIATSLHRRTRATLFALYITQAATGLATFLVAFPVFILFGYATPFTLAFAAGVLQFLPVVGPSVVVLALVAFELTRGAFVTAGLLLVVGLVLIGFLPDAVLRPRLARRTADLPASLYFVGFTGGILSLGAIGIIAGPLAVALLVEIVSMLADEIHPERNHVP